MTPEHLRDDFRKQAEAHYALARVTKDATERLAHILNAMEYEARALDVERGKLPPPHVVIPPRGGERLGLLGPDLCLCRGLDRVHRAAALGAGADGDSARPEQRLLASGDDPVQGPGSIMPQRKFFSSAATRS